MDPISHEHRHAASTEPSSLFFQLQCFIAYAEDVDIDGDTLDDILHTEIGDAEDDFDPVGIDLDSLFKSARPDKIPWTKNEIRFMLNHLKQKGMTSFINEYVAQRNISIPTLLLAFGVDLAPPLHEKPHSTLLYFLRVALSRELQLREKLSEYNTIEDAVNLIRRCRKIIILTGAGISVSCGIPDFRSENGIYASLRQDSEYELDDPQQMFDVNFFRENPRVFYSFASKIYPSNFTPSPCHRFLKLVEDKGKLLRNYTQNIDTLEQAAGVQRVLNCHGSFATATCLECGLRVPGSDIESAIMSQKIPLCPNCSAKLKKPKSRKKPKNDADEDPAEFPPGIMKPDITFFGEKLADDFDKALEEDREHVDLLLVIGTSLKVAPVADMLAHLPHSIPQILINKTPVRHINPDIILLGNADDIVQHLCAMLNWTLPLPSMAETGDTTDTRTLRKRTTLQEFGQTKRVGDSHIWLFKGAEGGKWLRDVRIQLGLPHEDPDFSGSKLDKDYRAKKKIRIEM